MIQLRCVVREGYAYTEYILQEERDTEIFLIISLSESLMEGKTKKDTNH